MVFSKKNHNLFKKYSVLFSLIILNHLYPKDSSGSKISIYPHNRKLLETYSNKVLDGSVSLFYKNGQPEWRNTYYKGILHGLSTKWDISGKKIMEGYYNNGDSSGVWFWWNTSGELIGEKSFDNILLKNNKLKKYRMILNK
jgi:antitoxin component YwqK of YwqJK toxin-antitoxin module